MRKILSEKESEKKRKTNTLLLSIVMLAVLLVGTIGYGFMSSTRTPKNNDGETNSSIRNVGGRWEINYNNNLFYLDNSLEEVKNISVTSYSTLSSLAKSTLYISSDNDAVFSELYSVLGRYAKTQKACYGPCEEDLPEKNCTDNLIVWKDSAENKVSQEGKCIFIEGDLRAADAFIYKLLDFH